MQPADRNRVIFYLISHFTTSISEFNAALAKVRQPVLAEVHKLALRHIQTMFQAACFGRDYQPSDYMRVQRGHEHAPRVRALWHVLGGSAVKAVQTPRRDVRRV